MADHWITEERRTELLAVIRQQQGNWVSNYSRCFDDPVTVTRTFSSEEPMTFTYGGREYVLNEAELYTSVGNCASGKLYIRLEEGKDILLSDVIPDAKLTGEADGNMCMAISMIGAELSQKMMQSFRDGPTGDPFMNMLSRLFRN